MRYVLDDLLEEFFSCMPFSEYKGYEIPSLLKTDKCTPSNYLDENGLKVSRKTAAHRCTPEGYPLNRHPKSKVRKSKTASLIHRMAHMDGFENFRVISAFSTGLANVVHTEERFDDDYISKADLQQFPQLLIEGRYKNPSFWRALTTRNRKLLRDYDHDYRGLICIKDIRFSGLVKLYTDFHELDVPRDVQQSIRWAIIGEDSKRFPTVRPYTPHKWRPTTINNSYILNITYTKPKPNYFMTAPYLTITLKGPSATPEHKLLNNITLEKKRRYIDRQRKELDQQEQNI
ncbi:hypothetical protein ACFL0V_02390 [Nanoarchaeota archaeon]